MVVRRLGVSLCSTMGFEDCYARAGSLVLITSNWLWDYQLRGGGEPGDGLGLLKAVEPHLEGHWYFFIHKFFLDID